jgi:hypothetical protein
MILKQSFGLTLLRPAGVDLQKQRLQIGWSETMRENIR